MDVRARCDLQESQLEDHRNVISTRMAVSLAFSPFPQRLRTEVYARLRFSKKPRIPLILAKSHHFYFLLFILTACSTTPGGGERFGARAVDFDTLSGWQQDNHAAALKTFVASCNIAPPKAGTLQVPASVWRSICDEAARTSPQQAQTFFERRFQPLRISNNDKEQGLFTGYYEPVLRGSLKKHGDYRIPMYSKPSELETGKPYFTRAEINRGAIAGRGLELLWVDDPVGLFFFQVQGSGRVLLDDGRKILIGFAAKNGQPYVSLGKVMGDEGLLPKDKINSLTIKQWLRAHPKQAAAIMEKNPSYIFFRRLDTSGPVGGAGAVLTEGRSLAIDNRYIPYGLPLFVETDLPGGAPMRRLFIAQDTGSAITGPVRGDIFFGFGREAENLASYMKSRGVYSLLVPREMASSL